MLTLIAAALLDLAVEIVRAVVNRKLKKKEVKSNGEA